MVEQSTNKELSMVINELTNRLQLAAKLGMQFGGDRDTYTVLGYPTEIDQDDILARYKRQDITKRIVDAYPEAIWQKDIFIQDDPDSQDETQFEKAFIELNNKINIYNYLNRVDKLARLGEYSVLFLGFNDGKDLNQPVSKATKLQYMMAFSAKNATITKYVDNEKDERFGLPLEYKIVTGGYDGTLTKATTKSSKTLEVHHSRIIHVAEGLLENDVFGASVVEPIYNRLIDLDKIVGGSGELFWLNARAGLHINAPNGIDAKDKDALQAEIDNYVHKLTRILKTKNMEVNALSMQVPSPRDAYDVVVELISTSTGIPKRILTGSERGELASSQDETNWNNRIKERRENHCEPFIIRPLVQRLINVGVLPKPKSELFTVEWPELGAMTQSERATVAQSTATALSTFAGSSASSLMTDEQFIEDVLGLEYRKEEIDKQLQDEIDNMGEDNGNQGSDQNIAPADGSSEGNPKTIQKDPASAL